MALQVSAVGDAVQ